jgi:hypothetical protein
MFTACMLAMRGDAAAYYHSLNCHHHEGINQCARVTSLNARGINVEFHQFNVFMKFVMYQSIHHWCIRVWIILR